MSQVLVKLTQKTFSKIQRTIQCEEIFTTLLHNQRRMIEFVQSSYGNAQRKKSINRERVAGHNQLVNDYFSAEPVYTYDMFRWQFRMRKMLFCALSLIWKIIPTYILNWEKMQRNEKAYRRFTNEQRLSVNWLMEAPPTNWTSTYEWRNWSNNCTRMLVKLLPLCDANIWKRVLKKLDATDSLFASNAWAKTRFLWHVRSLDRMHWDWKICPVEWRASTHEAIMTTQQSCLRRSR